MNEVTRIHLGRQPFTIAVDAQKLLKAYLAAIEKHVGKNADEVLEEVELRVAELLLERGITGDKAVLVADIEYIKEQLGKPADFGDSSEAEEDEPPASDAPRRLFRDTENGKLGGVAAGLATYFGLDVTFIRIAFIILTLLWGGGIVLYLIMWLVVPEAKTGSDYLQLKGKPITVDTIKEFVDQADVPHRAERARTAGVRLLARLARMVAWVFGLALALLAAVTALWTIAFGVYAWIVPERLSDAGQIFPKEAQDYYFIAAAMTVIISICSLLFLAGIALMRRKRTVPGWVSGGILAIAFVGTAIGLPLGFKVVPDVADRYEAATQVRSRNLAPFTALGVDGDRIKVQFMPSDTYKVSVKSTGKINDKAIHTAVKDGVLSITAGEFRPSFSCTIFCIGSSQPELTVYAPILTKVELQNGAVFRVNEQLRQDTFELVTDGSGSAGMNYIDAASAKLTTDGSRRTLTLQGLRQAANQGDGLVVDGYIGFVSLTRASNVELIGGQECEDFAPLLYLGVMPKELKIDGQSFADQRTLEDAQEINQMARANCITISTSFNHDIY